MLLVGIDWADQEHVYCLMEEAGATLSTGTIEHTAEGLEHFMTAVRARVHGPTDVLVAIETSHGPLVGALLEHGFIGYALNPKAVESDACAHRKKATALRTPSPRAPGSRSRSYVPVRMQLFARSPSSAARAL